MTGWNLRCRGIDWPCRTEEDLMGVIVFLKKYGREPLGKIDVTPEPPKDAADLLSTLTQQGQLL